jgi:hypothetical protein
MRHVALLFILAVSMARVAAAQENFQVGVYGDYFRLSQTNTDMAGVGARVTTKVFPYVMLEGEASYDFKRTFTEDFTGVAPPIPIPVAVNSNLKVLHGLFGPKLVAGHGAIRPFFVLKGGFLNFRFDPRPNFVATLTSSVENLRSNNVTGTLYPGGGLEGHLGPVGLRFEAGDEIFFAGGTHHNPRVSFGPFIRF